MWPRYALFQIARNSESDVAYDESQEAVSGSDDNSTSGESIHLLQHIRGMIRNKSDLKPRACFNFCHMCEFHITMCRIDSELV